MPRCWDEVPITLVDVPVLTKLGRRVIKPLACIGVPALVYINNVYMLTYSVYVYMLTYIYYIYIFTYYIYIYICCAVLYSMGT